MLPHTTPDRRQQVPNIGWVLNVPVYRNFRIAEKSKAVAFGIWLKALDQCDALGGSPSPYINAYHIYFLPLLVE